MTVRPRADVCYDSKQALRCLRRGDAALGRLMRRVGPFTLQRRKLRSPFQSLLRAIVYQQLSGRAASAIHARVLSLVSGTITPKKLLALPERALREAGLSRAKVLAVQDLAAKTLDRTVPTLAKLERMDDDDIVERLVCVRGVGRWSVEMMLIFQLGRADVLPATDLGVRKGYAVCYGDDELPSPRALLESGERWRPYRSVASWYLWRANELP